MILAETKTLASISEYGEDSRSSSLTGLSSSTYVGYTRSPSGESLNTLGTSTSRSYTPKNGMPRERKTNSENMLTQRLRKQSLTQKRNYEFCKKVRVTIALIGILLLVAAIFMLSFYLPKQYEPDSDRKPAIPPKNKRFIWDDNIEIKDDLLLLFSTNFSGPVLESESGPDIALKAYFGELLSDDSRKQFSKVDLNDSIQMTFQGLDKDTYLEVKKVGFHEQCYGIHWVTKHHKKLQDCFDTEDSHWFGLGETFNQAWPIDKAEFAMTKFVTTDYLSPDEGVLGGVLEPLFINSKGAGIYVSDSVPLYVGMNEDGNNKLCIRADRKCEDFKTNETNKLNYTICVANNIREVHKILFDQFFEIPSDHPDKRMITEPIWSTWAKYKTNINQSIILKYAENIKKYNFPSSHLVIGDKYSTAYGDLNFDPKKFSDYSYMINRLRSDGFRTTVWVPPFCNFESRFFLKGFDFWLKVGSKEKKVPGIVKWYNGYGGVLDVTNDKATNWYIKRLKEFQKLKLDGFKFDGGDVKSLPLNYIFSKPLINPNYYTKYYVQFASTFPLSEVKVGYKSQKYPIFVRLLDRRSSWDSQSGLRSVLSAALTLGILGYPFVLPDMVGGNAYIDFPNKQLYVRWVQLCTFLPSIQFSIPPWDFNQEVISMVQEALAVRKKISNYIFALAQNVSISGEPIVRPLWWYWPNDQETFVIGTQFMLGDQYLIAPVLNPIIIQHAIYLPAGIWEEQWGKRSILNMTEGGIQHYTVTLRTICYFKLIKILQGKN